MTRPKGPASAKSVGTVAIALAGPSFIWALHFGTVYGLHSLFCTAIGGPWGGMGAQIGILAATAVAVPVLLFFAAKPERVLRSQPSELSGPFLTGVMRLLALVCCFGVLWAGSAALFLPACRSLA